MKKHKLLWICVAIGTLLLVLFNWNKILAAVNGKPKQPSNPGTGGTATGADLNPGYSSGTPVNMNIVLTDGSTGQEVIQLQQLLNAGWSAGLAVDGNFGPQTAAALEAATGDTSTTLANMIARYNAHMAVAGVWGAGSSGGSIWSEISDFFVG